MLWAKLVRMRQELARGISPHSQGLAVERELVADKLVRGGRRDPVRRDRVLGDRLGVVAVRGDRLENVSVSLREREACPQSRSERFGTRRQGETYRREVDGPGILTGHHVLGGLAAMLLRMFAGGLDDLFGVEVRRQTHSERVRRSRVSLQRRFLCVPLRRSGSGRTGSFSLTLVAL